jgi:hypothetical protein
MKIFLNREINFDMLKALINRQKIFINSKAYYLLEITPGNMW